MSDAALSSASVIDAQHPNIDTLGCRVLQPFLFAHTEAAHVHTLLTYADFPANAKVLDVGCGIGECARLMHALRPDLEFVLLNFSAQQLADCPPQFERHLGNAHALPFADASFDAVMFNASLGNMDAMVAMAEAARVLKPEGVLFLNELAGANEALARLLSYRAYDRTALEAFAAAMGLRLHHSAMPTVCVETVKPHLHPDDYAAVFAGVTPTIWRFNKTKRTLAAQFGYLFAKHERIALQCSGGKDSLAVLHAFRPWWHRLCVYWVNPGDPFPETLARMADIKASVPYFVEVAGRQQAIIAEGGWPSDVVPHAYTKDGNFVFGPTPFKVQTRLDCCYRALMLPMHERMLADGVQCIIRGKRAAEKDKTPTRTGAIAEGIETIYPLWAWSESEVLDYLNAEGIALPPSYHYAGHSLDCMSCTAWWGEGLANYLLATYPDHYREYKRRVTAIKEAVFDQLRECEV